MNTGKEYKTKQRAQLEKLFESKRGECLTVKEVCAELAKENIKIGETTVYRNLEKMYDAGILKRYENSGKSAGYCLEKTDCGDLGEHYHLRCVCCGETVCLDCGIMKNMQSHIAKEHGFKLDTEKTVLYGICADCASAAKNKNNTKKNEGQK